MLNIEGQIKEFLAENFMAGEENLNHDASFLELGLIDSTGVLELVAFVEDAFGLSVEDQEIIPDNFDSINKLAGFIRRKRGSERSVAQPVRERVPVPAGVS
jgi:acyl carrier protein